jgi:hypothetical protein
MSDQHTLCVLLSVNGLGWFSLDVGLFCISTQPGMGLLVGSWTPTEHDTATSWSSLKMRYMDKCCQWLMYAGHLCHHIKRAYVTSIGGPVLSEK